MWVVVLVLLLVVVVGCGLWWVSCDFLMGCAASKIDNEDVVRRCKERRRLMKAAVYARRHLAGAHADYCRSLRLTGSALSAFADNEPLSVSDQTPAVFVLPRRQRSPYSSAPAAAASQPSFRRAPSASPAVPEAAVPEARPPATPPPPPAAPPLSPTVASSKLPHILSASDRNPPPPRVGGSHHNPHRRRNSKPMKLPHILSESSPNSSPRSLRSDFTPGFYPTAYADSTYTSTPSQASSVWNWENCYPPSPPDSEFFDQRARSNNQRQPQPENGEEGDGDASASEYDFFRRDAPGKVRDGEAGAKPYDFKRAAASIGGGGGETEREEVQCSDWGDHYSTTSSSEYVEEGDDDDDHDGASRSEIGGTRSNFGGSARSGVVGAEPMKPPQPEVSFGKSDDKSEDMSYGEHEMVEEENRMVVRHRDLKEIVDAIKENFDMAASAGEPVSVMLEIGRAQLDSSFKQLKSELLFSVLFQSRRN